MSKSRTFTTHVSTTNVAAGTNYYTITGDKITHFSVFMACSGGVTVTVDGTMVESPTGTDWVDVTKSMYSLGTGVGSKGGGAGGGNASYIDKNDIISIDDTPLFRGYRIKSVTADNTNAVKIVSCVEGEDIQISE